MSIKVQHRGHCQACGRVQVTDGLLAKHGYRVAGFGYFNGVCHGAGASPLEQDRGMTDRIIADLTKQADRNEARASALRDGECIPHHAQRLHSNGNRVREYSAGKQAPVLVPWAGASEAERAMQVQTEIGDAESFARHARSHAASMSKLAERVHGQPLIDREQEELDRVAARKAKSDPIEGAYRTKAEQKRALETLSREYSKAREVITGRYLSEVRRDPACAAVYYGIPHELHQWREKTSALVLKVYPELLDTVNKIRGLLVARDVVRARPVIK